MKSVHPCARSVALSLAFALAAATATASGDTADGDARVAAAEQLVAHLDLANTDYAHGPGTVDWSGTVASHTDCSGFIDHLLMHVDGYSPEDFKRWFGTRRPTADRYHDAIVEGRGFSVVPAVDQMQVGDVIAIKYLTRHDNTGHIMLVTGRPQRMTPGVPVVGDTVQWSVEVIDSSESGHGPTDTRYKRASSGRDHEGLGRGVVRLYANANGEVVGFAWSTSKFSRFVAPADEHVVLGRFLTRYRP